MSHVQQSSQNPTMNARLASLLNCFSIEVTLPNEAELDELRNVLNTATLIYVSAPLGQSHKQLALVAKQVRQFGFEPVPHIVARSFPDRASLQDFVQRVTGEAGVRQALVIAGDVDHPAGPFFDANAVIESDLLQCGGVTHVGISGYPEGHPKLGEGILSRAFSDKLKSAQARGLRVHIVSQFCFDGNQIAYWLRLLRASGVDVPIKIGLAGPTSVKGLARYALRCGVRTSFKAVLSGKATQLFGEMPPDAIIERFAEALDVKVADNISFHYFSFGGIGRTARWVTDYRHRVMQQNNHDR